MDQVTPVSAMTKSRFTRQFMSDQSKRKREKEFEKKSENADILGYIADGAEKIRRRTGR